MKSITNKNAFTLVETLTALAVLALICSSMLVVVDRNITAAADSAAKIKAFEVARENLETLLAQNIVEDSVDFGQSEKYPDITWKTTIESFYEPVTSVMWVQANCQASYYDSENEEQSVELTHWLTNLSKEQIADMLLQQGQGSELLNDQIVATLQQAADYAGVDLETINEWVGKGMLITDDGKFVKNQLDLFIETDGSPSPQDIQLQAEADQEILEAANNPSPPETTNPDPEASAPDKNRVYKVGDVIRLPNGGTYTITPTDLMNPSDALKSIK